MVNKIQTHRILRLRQMSHYITTSVSNLQCHVGRRKGKGSRNGAGRGVSLRKKETKSKTSYAYRMRRPQPFSRVVPAGVVIHGFDEQDLGLGEIEKSSIRTGPRGEEKRLCCCACGGVGAGMVLVLRRRRWR